MTRTRKGVDPPYGNHTFVLTKEEVLSLLEGKVLGDPDFDEYGTFITMEKEE